MIAARALGARHDGLAPSGSRSFRARSVLHIAAPAAFGGLESALQALAAGQRRRGHSVTVAMVLEPAQGTVALAHTVAARGVQVEEIRVGARAYMRERAAVRSLIRAIRPDIVHTHGFRPDAVDGGVARGERLPVVSTCHGFIESDWRGRVYQSVQRQLLRRFDAVIAVSSPIAVRLRQAGVAASKVHVLPNGFSAPANTRDASEAREILGLPPGPVVGWVGRLSMEKGPDLALDAFARLGGVARLAMIGAGREESALRQRARTLGIADRVTWCGAVRDAGSLFTAFDAFLLSSRTEGTPIALLEAMAAGVPVVAARVGGVPDVVDDTSALLVEPGSVDGLASAIAHTLDNPGPARLRAGRAVARLASHFSVDPWLVRHESIYEATLAR